MKEVKWWVEAIFKFISPMLSGMLIAFMVIRKLPTWGQFFLTLGICTLLTIIIGYFAINYLDTKEFNKNHE